MHPIRYRLTPTSRIEQLAPDVLVASVPDHPRSSYDLATEGVAPSFVLEVLSPESRSRDLEIKPDRYEAIGVHEYAIFAPPTPDGRLLLQPPLQGYRQDRGTGGFVRWEADEAGRLWSEALGLWLVARGEELRLQRPDGSWVPTLIEAEDARRREVWARQEAESARTREAQARLEAEAEVARLRAELERHDSR